MNERIERVELWRRGVDGGVRGAELVEEERGGVSEVSKRGIEEELTT